jgi:hypothetical protein
MVAAVVADVAAWAALAAAALTALATELAQSSTSVARARIQSSTAGSCVLTHGTSQVW